LEDFLVEEGLGLEGVFVILLRFSFCFCFEKAEFLKFFFGVVTTPKIVVLLAVGV
jgi:hypothetical protein